MSDLILETFCLKRQPFTVDIDVDGLFPFQSFKQGLLRLEQAALQRGAILVVAEPGAGKTALVRAVAKRLGATSFSIFEQLVAPGRHPIRAVLEGLLTQMGEPLPFNNPGRSWAKLRGALVKISDKHRTPVLILDDVHHLTVNCWLSLKTIMNFELDSKMPLLLALLGGPGATRQLSFETVEEVRDRISSCFHLTGLQPAEVKPYLEHRLKWAGATRPIFPDDVIVELGRHARGNPRRVNRLAAMSLMAAASQGRQLVDRDCLDSAISEIQFKSPPAKE